MPEGLPVPRIIVCSGYVVAYRSLKWLLTSPYTVRSSQKITYGVGAGGLADAPPGAATVGACVPAFGLTGEAVEF